MAYRSVDRLKDMVLVSGFNDYPNEVENVVFTHPDVLEVMKLAEVVDFAEITG